MRLFTLPVMLFSAVVLVAAIPANAQEGLVVTVTNSQIHNASVDSAGQFASIGPAAAASDGTPRVAVKVLFPTHFASSSCSAVGLGQIALDALIGQLQQARAETFPTGT